MVINLKLKFQYCRSCNKCNKKSGNTNSASIKRPRRAEPAVLPYKTAPNIPIGKVSNHWTGLLANLWALGRSLINWGVRVLVEEAERWLCVGVLKAEWVCLGLKYLALWIWEDGGTDADPRGVSANNSTADAVSSLTTDPVRPYGVSDYSVK